MFYFLLHWSVNNGLLRNQYGRQYRSQLSLAVWDHHMSLLVLLYSWCLILVYLELGERGREFSAKDIMSSVFSAANKKVRRRGDKSKGDSIDADMESEV